MGRAASLEQDAEQEAEGSFGCAMARNWGKEKSMRQGNKGGGSAPWHSRVQRPAEEPGARREMEKSSSGGGWKMKVGHGMKKI